MVDAAVPPVQTGSSQTGRRSADSGGVWRAGRGEPLVLEDGGQNKGDAVALPVGDAADEDRDETSVGRQNQEPADCREPRDDTASARLIALVQTQPLSRCLTSAPPSAARRWRYSGEILPLYITERKVEAELPWPGGPPVRFAICRFGSSSSG